MSTDSSPMLNVPAPIQAAVDADEWSAWIAEHRPGAAHGGVCPKCGITRVRYFEPKSRYECPERGFVEPAPKTGLRRV